MVDVGETVRLPLAAGVPADWVKAASVYHFHEALVPNVPPVGVNVELLPLQIVAGLALAPVGATDGLFTVTLTLCAGVVAVQGLLVPSIRTQ